MARGFLVVATLGLCARVRTGLVDVGVLTRGRLFRAMLVGVALSVASGGGGQSPPNLILFMTDDQGIDAIEGPGWPNDLECHTPEVANIASQGRVFVQARVNPKCSPTRAGLLTGRPALTTGVTSVIGGTQPTPDRDLLSLQTGERTIAEALREAGYYTILVDKWHVGWAQEQRPIAQGFDVYHNYQRYVDLDDPIVVGDEHVSLMVDLAVSSVNERPDPSQPYALFFWSIDPHWRYDQSGRERLSWWRVHDRLLPSGEDYYAPGADNNRNRYRAVVEAQDTEFGRLLRELGVLHGGRYREGSDTVVFFLSDNGTHPDVSLTPDHAKGSLFEGGVRVPLVVFGEQVPSDGQHDHTLVSHLDFYDTILDVIGASSDIRRGPPRDSWSFADRIGWRDEAPRREYVLLSRGEPALEDHQIALVSERFKLIAPAAPTSVNEPLLDQFYDLLTDPAEDSNLAHQGMTPEQESEYLTMREVISTYWPGTVTVPTPRQIDIPPTSVAAINSLDVVDLVSPFAVGHDESGSQGPVESALLARFAIDQIDRLLPPGRSIDDIIAAEFILEFDQDILDEYDADTGPIRVYPMMLSWSGRGQSWEQVIGSAHSLECGWFDPPPHILVHAQGTLAGVPLPPGAAISLGQNEAALEIVRYWQERPYHNYGVIARADRLETGAGGDQSLFLNAGAFLRLTLRP